VVIFDPSEFIAAESQRIPFKAALSKPHEWQVAFKNWPLPPIAGWRNWYKRMLDDDNVNISNWDNLRIAHCLELPWLKHQKMRIFLLQPAIFGRMVPMPFFLAMGQCPPLWPMYT
jgi:hypothetical protein